MQDQKLTLDMVEKVHKLAAAGCFFSNQFLKDHDLLNEDIIDYLFFNDYFLDGITLPEAIWAIPSKARRFRSNSQKANREKVPIEKQIRRGIYAPKDLLDNTYQYMIVLKARDQYMPIKEVLKILNIKRSALSRRMAKKNVSRLFNNFITIEDFGKIHDTNRVYIKTAAEILGISVWTLRRHAKKIGINIERGFIEEKNINKFRPRVNVPTQKAANILKTDKNNLNKIAKVLEVRNHGGHSDIEGIKISRNHWLSTNSSAPAPFSQ